MAALTVAALTTVALGLTGGLAEPARAAGGPSLWWGRPFAFSPSQPIDIMPPQVAIAVDGESAVTFTIQDENNPAYSRAFVTLRARNGRLTGPLRVPGAVAVLDVAFDGSTLELLTGSAPAHQTCCSSAGVLALAGRKFGAVGTLVKTLGGATEGRLAVLSNGRLLAAIASDGGVWAAESSTRGVFPTARRLASGSAVPATLAAAALRRGDSAIAWTEDDGSASLGDPDRIFTAAGSANGPPVRARAAVATVAGHEIDELALAASASTATAGWIESWFDGSGEYQSVPVVSDLGGSGEPVSFPTAGQVASGLSLTGDGRGEQLLAWKSCDPSAACTVQATLRPPGGRFGAPVELGAIDAYEDPATAVAPDGASLVGWVDGGRAFAVAGGRGAGTFGSPQVLSAAGEASGLALALGPADQALAAWTQGVSELRVFGATARPR